MADESIVSEIVSKFFLNTCRLRPQLSEDVVYAIARCAELVTTHPDDDA